MPEQNNETQQGQQPQIQPPEKRFRWEIVVLPLCCLAAMWLAQGMEPVVTWNAVMDFQNIENGEEYTNLAIVGMVMIAVTGIARVVWSNRSRH